MAFPGFKFQKFSGGEWTPLIMRGFGVRHGQGFRLDPRLCLGSMLTAKMFVIQTRNYILKCVNSLVLFTEMACDKNQTYLQVR